VEDPFAGMAGNLGVDQSLPPVLWAALAAGAAGVVAFAAIFLTVSLYIPRALLTGIIYSFVWESLLGRFLPGVRVVSVRHYVQSIFAGLLDDDRIEVANAFSPTSSFVTLGVASLVAILLATWRLRRMNLE
jgi:ABC-2 type transport system permease protein